jgi:hypothetical protein
MTIYLDHQATTPCDPRVVAAMMPYFGEFFGNPHSAEHAMGRQAEAAVDTARAQIAALIGAEPREIILTSGATEANNLAIKGAARFAAAGDRKRLITLATEHKCVLESVRDLAAEGFAPVILPVGRDGLADLARRRARCSIATSPRLPAKSLSMCMPWASRWPRSAPTSSMARRESARFMSAAVRACAWPRYFPAAGRSGACAAVHCPPRWQSASAKPAGLPWPK